MSSTALATEANPFTGKQALATVHVESERAVAEVQAAMMLARRFPRNHVESMDRILNACTRKSLAENATYVFQKGGTDVNAANIRLAEVLAQNWGNLQFGIRELEQRAGESTVEAFCWDVETNTRQVKVFQVRHERHSNEWINGKATGQKIVKRLTDPRDIYETVANQGARRLRSCILGIIPGDVTEAAVNQCEVTVKLTAEVTPDSIKKVLEAFEQFKVTREQIEALNGRRMDAMQPGQLVRLRKIFASLTDGMSEVKDWFKGEIKPFPIGNDSPPAGQTATAANPPQGEAPSGGAASGAEATSAGTPTIVADAHAEGAGVSVSPAPTPSPVAGASTEEVQRGTGVQSAPSRGATPARRTPKPEAPPLVLDGNAEDTAKARLERRVHEFSLDRFKVQETLDALKAGDYASLTEEQCAKVLKDFDSLKEACRP